MHANDIAAIRDLEEPRRCLLAVAHDSDVVADPHFAQPLSFNPNTRLKDGENRPFAFDADQKYSACKDAT